MAISSGMSYRKSDQHTWKRNNEGVSETDKGERAGGILELFLSVLLPFYSLRCNPSAL